jgi:hypothetical protein
LLSLEGVIFLQVRKHFWWFVAVLAFRVLSVFFDAGLAAILLDCIQALLLATADVGCVFDA